MNKHLYLLCFSLLFSTVLSAQLLRGPYLQKQTSTSMNVKWRTATMTSGKVYYGTDMNNLNLTATDTVNVADHDVHISGLQPFTKYYYKIESDNVVLSGPDNNHHFKNCSCARYSSAN
jgi:phosphodiesterase/alkaline phosphatase D-like protein